ncbi:MAG TPA: hypothetical protein ENN43_01815 [bacterium]|nr:hypothetical protein [bacterium]
MKRFIVAAMLLVFSVSMLSAEVVKREDGSYEYTGKVTSKVDRLMATNTDREKTYYPRDLRDNQISIKMGLPLVAGIGYSKNINPYVGIGVGVGSSFPGIAADMNVTWYILPHNFTPYVTAGVVYYGDFGTNLIAAEVAGGVDYLFENGFGLNLGLCWVKSLTTSPTPFQTAVFVDEINALNLQGGINFRF